MIEKIGTGDLIGSVGLIPIIDVRSPSEFSQGHIPHAVNMPLFSDEERESVGITYKQQSKKAAINLGLDIVGPRMSKLTQFAESLSSDELLLYCWRGGMRSESVGWLLYQYGFSVKLLDGGYKNYRQALLDFFKEDLPLVVLSGFTGSKKTEILHAMKGRGEQVIDLEGLAHHQGSSFGKQLAEEQPTVEQFQNSLFHEFLGMDLSRRIWLEDESFRIGSVNLVESLYQQKNNSPHVFLNIPKETRVKHLVENYGGLPKKKLIRATEDISKKLGLKETDEAISQINNHHLERAASIILKYYDKRYSKSIQAKKDHVILEISEDSNDSDYLARRILEELSHARLQAHTI